MLSVISWAAVYFVIWWTTLFAVLPFAVRGSEGSEDAVAGADAGAPRRARIGRTFLVTTAVACLIFLALYLVMTRGLFGLDDIPFLPRFEKIV